MKTRAKLSRGWGSIGYMGGSLCTTYVQCILTQEPSSGEAREKQKGQRETPLSSD